jgi:low affinity Fe/Cu permease
MRTLFDSGFARARAWVRARREEAAARQAARPIDPPQVTVPEWLVRAAYFASWVAMASLVYFLWLYTLDVARDRAGAMHVTHAGAWIGDLKFWFPYIAGFAIVAFGIPYVAKIAIPTFMTLDWRQNFWPKSWALVIALAVSLVVVSGTFAVQGDTLMERDRESAVAVEQVGNSRAALQAEIDGLTADLNTAMNNPNRIMAQAASVGVLGGAEEWERSYVAQARATGDARLPLLERATGAARAAKAASDRRADLRRQLAMAPTAASVQGEVVTARTSWIADTLGWLEGVRAILLSLVMDIVALMMPWIALRLEQARARQLASATGVAGSGWADESRQIEDLRHQPPGKVQRDRHGHVVMERPREKAFDADTGEELVNVRPHEYWRRKVPHKGKPTRVHVEAERLPDEPGVEGYATARVLANGQGVMLGEPEAAPAAQPEPPRPAADEADEPMFDEELSEEEATELLQGAEDVALDDEDDTPGVAASEDDSDEQPRTGRKLIAAE